MNMIIQTKRRNPHTRRAEQFIGAIDRAPVSNGLGFTVAKVWKPEEAARFSAEEAQQIAADLNAHHARTGLGEEWVVGWRAPQSVAPKESDPSAMHLIVSSGERLELNLTKQDALKLIEKLSVSVAHSDRTGSAWFADDVTVKANGERATGRITIRVEG